MYKCIYTYIYIRVNPSSFCCPSELVYKKGKSSLPHKHTDGSYTKGTGAHTQK